MKKKEAAKFNQKAKSGKTPLGIAIENNNLKSMKALLKGGSKVNEVVSNIGVSYYPLNLAVNLLKPEVVKLLLEYKADVNGLDSMNYTPLQNLFSKSESKYDKDNKADLEIAKLLVEHGANIYVLTPDGKKLGDLIPKGRKTELRAFLDDCYAKDREKNNTNFEQEAVQKSFASKEEERRKESQSLGISRMK